MEGHGADVGKPPLMMPVAGAALAHTLVGQLKDSHAVVAGRQPRAIRAEAEPSDLVAVLSQDNGLFLLAEEVQLNHVVRPHGRQPRPIRTKRRGPETVHGGLNHRRVAPVAASYTPTRPSAHDRQQVPLPVKRHVFRLPFPLEPGKGRLGLRKAQKFDTPVPRGVG